MRKLSGILLAGIILAACLTATDRVWAGTPLFMDRSVDYSITYDFSKPKWQYPSKVDFFSGTHSIGIRSRAANNVYFIGQFTYWRIKTPYYDYDDLIANPYLGFEFVHRDNLWFNFGFVIPTASKDNAAVAPLIAEPHRFGVFVPDYLGITGEFHAGKDWGLLAEYLHVDLAVMLPTVYEYRTPSPGPGDMVTELDTEAYLGCGLAWDLTGEVLSLWGDLRGLYVLTEEGDFADCSTFWLTLGARTVAGMIRPGLRLSVPFDEQYANVVDFTYAFTLTAAWGD
jgi:hypothetical protein